MGNTLATIRARALAALIPPPRLHLSQWIEREIVLPEGTSALPGRVRLWPYQREIADAISDPLIERVTLRRGQGGARGDRNELGQWSLLRVQRTLLDIGAEWPGSE